MTESVLDLKKASSIICKEGGVSNDLRNLIKNTLFLISRVKSIGIFYKSSVMLTCQVMIIIQILLLLGTLAFKTYLKLSFTTLYLVQKDQDNLKHINLIKSRALPSSTACISMFS